MSTLLCDPHSMVIFLPLFLKLRDDGLVLTVNRCTYEQWIFNSSKSVVAAQQNMLKLECRLTGWEQNVIPKNSN